MRYFVSVFLPVSVEVNLAGTKYADAIPTLCIGAKL
jgi:hypothetical protein